MFMPEMWVICIQTAALLFVAKKRKIAEQEKHEALMLLASLIDQVNRKGGQAFLDHGSISLNRSQFNEEDLKKLKILLHPDMHHKRRKGAAEEMFKKVCDIHEVAR